MKEKGERKDVRKERRKETGCKKEIRNKETR